MVIVVQKSHHPLFACLFAPSSAVGRVALVLRYALVEVATARQASDRKQTKMELVYGYLTGPSFRQRVEAIKEAFENMREDLEAEKKVIQKQWAKRHKQIEA